MNGYELARQLQRSKTEQQRFIKWWRKENDFADFELVDEFLDHLVPEHEFGGYELLTLDQMWQELKRRDPRRVSLERRHGKTVIRWQHETEDGRMIDDVFPFSAEALMAIFEGETRGDTLC